MIIAPIQDRVLLAAVNRAALPEEDVFHRLEDVDRALRFGYPRLLICRGEDQRRLRRDLPLGDPAVPILAVGDPTLRRWEDAWESQGLAISRIDDSALRLRSLIEETAAGADWVEGVFSDLTHIVGRGLPANLRGFSRRIMEFPARYSSLAGVGTAFGISAGALKARFRRRDLPSPSRYLRWFRLISAARVLADPRETTLSTSYRLGFESDGNFCRWIRANAGMTPSLLRGWNGRLLLLVRLAEDCLSNGALDAWGSFGEFFLRRVA